jgi:hypothetical protein
MHRTGAARPGALRDVRIEYANRVKADIDEPSRIAMGGNSLFSIRAAKSLLSNLEFQCRKTPRFDDGNRHRNIRTPSDGNHHY